MLNILANRFLVHLFFVFCFSLASCTSFFNRTCTDEIGLYVILSDILSFNSVLNFDRCKLFDRAFLWYKSYQKRDKNRLKSLRKKKKSIL